MDASELHEFKKLVRRWRNQAKNAEANMVAISEQRQMWGGIKHTRLSCADDLAYLIAQKEKK